MEADRSPDMPVSWRSRGHVCQSGVQQAQGQENPPFSLDQRQKKKPMSQFKGNQAGRVPSSSLDNQPCCSSRPSTDWMRPADPGASCPLDSRVNLIQKHLPRHTQNYARVNT